MAKWVVREGNVFWPSEEMKKVANISNSDVYEEADKNPVSFWEEKARELKWFKEWEKPYEENLPYFKWFIGGKINMSYNCLDVHLKDKGDKPAIIWEPEPPHGEARIITYNELYKEVNKFSNVLKKLGVKKGDRVGIYLPMIPEVQMAMLACARIGAIHTVVTLHLLWFTIFLSILHQFVKIEIPSICHVYIGPCSSHDDYLLNASILYTLICLVFKCNLLPPSVISIRSYEYLST